MYVTKKKYQQILGQDSKHGKMLDDLRNFTIKRTFGGWIDVSVGKMFAIKVRGPEFNSQNQFLKSWPR